MEESDNEEYRKIRREIATSSDMTEQQLLQGPGDIDSEFGKEGDQAMRQQEQLQTGARNDQ